MLRPHHAFIRPRMISDRIAQTTTIIHRPFSSSSLTLGVRSQSLYIDPTTSTPDERRLFKSSKTTGANSWRKVEKRAAKVHTSKPWQYSESSVDVDSVWTQSETGRWKMDEDGPLEFIPRTYMTSLKETRASSKNGGKRRAFVPPPDLVLSDYRGTLGRPRAVEGEGGDASSSRMNGRLEQGTMSRGNSRFGPRLSAVKEERNNYSPWSSANPESQASHLESFHHSISSPTSHTSPSPKLGLDHPTPSIPSSRTPTAPTSAPIIPNIKHLHPTFLITERRAQLRRAEKVRYEQAMKAKREEMIREAMEIESGLLGIGTSATESGKRDVEKGKQGTETPEEKRQRITRKIQIEEEVESRLSKLRSMGELSKPSHGRGKLSNSAFGRGPSSSMSDRKAGPAFSTERSRRPWSSPNTGSVSIMDLVGSSGKGGKSERRTYCTSRGLGMGVRAGGAMKAGGNAAAIDRMKFSTARGRRHSSQQATATATEVLGQTYPKDKWTNTPTSILSKLPQKLHEQPSHPIGILRNVIESHFADFKSISPPSAVVTTSQNFDDLGFAPDHPGRSLTDSYYLNETHMLRTHTSAHEVETFRSGEDKWLLTADVYRRDEIDATHYPVFHQMEGARVWSPSELAELPELNARMGEALAECNLIIEDPTTISMTNPYQPEHDPEVAAQIAQNLKHSLNGLIYKLFGNHGKTGGEPLRIRWIEAFFPFTSPSYEVEIWWGGQWLEILGSGVVKQKTLQTAGVPEKCGWAFGLGLERISMVLNSIPDIRLFWSSDRRFLSQFTPGRISTFKGYSKYPPCYKDVSFWLPVEANDALQEAEGAKAAGGAMPMPTAAKSKTFHENDFCEIVRDVAGDLIETVQLIDEFTNKKTGRNSKCYRLNYRSMDRSLSNEEVNKLQAEVVKRLAEEMDVELR